MIDLENSSSSAAHSGGRAGAVAAPASSETVAHERRLRRAQERCDGVLRTTLAQSEDVLHTGQRIMVMMDARTHQPLRMDFQLPSAGVDALVAAATKARVFTLKSEDIYYEKVTGSLRALASDPRYVEIIDGLEERWALLPLHRSTTFVRNDDGTGLPAEGVQDGVIAQRVLYSELVHADDAAAILTHIDTDQKHWALAGMVVDWICLAAQTQHLIHLIRADLTPAVTPWRGGPTSLFERWGVSWEEVFREGHCGTGAIVPGS